MYEYPHAKSFSLFPLAAAAAAADAAKSKMDVDKFHTPAAAW